MKNGSLNSLVVMKIILRTICMNFLLSFKSTLLVMMKDLAMKLFFATLHDNARRWYDGLPNKGIKTMDQFEETFLNEWSLYKRFSTLNISGYPNPFPLGLVDNCPKFDGNPSLAKPHVTKLLKYVSETKVRHRDVLVGLFLLYLGAYQREWVKHDIISNSIIYIKVFILLFLERWDPTMLVYKNTSTLQKEGLHPIPINEDQNQQEFEERVLMKVTNPMMKNNNLLLKIMRTWLKRKILKILNMMMKY
jgi:hypothetical protein